MSSPNAPLEPPTPVELDLATVDFPPGLSVIEASAGTGKTYSISHLVPRLLIEGTIETLGQLLLVTFTRDAARELGERVRRVLLRLAAEPDAAELGEPGGIVATLRARLAADPAARTRFDRALADLDLLAVSTIHSFCQRTLQQEGALCGLPVMPEVATDDATEVEQAVREAWLKFIPVDASLAALATARKWSVEKAVSFLRIYRMGWGPGLVPSARNFADLREEIAKSVAQLQDDARSGWSQVQAIFNQKPVLTQEAGGDVEAVLARCAVVCRGKSDTVEFWQNVEWAAELPKVVNGRSSKSAKQALEGAAWVRGVSALRALVEEAEWAWWAHLAATVPGRVDELLAGRRVITQDGLVAVLHAALHREAGAGNRLAARLAERYRAALVDESQDTDPRQFGIFRRVFLDQPERRLILIGDPKQAIYGFRGANLDTYFEAKAQARRVYILRKTFRAPPRLVGAVNALFERRGAFHHPNLVFKTAASGLAVDRSGELAGRELPRLTVWLARDDEPSLKNARLRQREICARCADLVVRLLVEGEVVEMPLGDGAAATGRRRVKPSDIAILMRDNAPARAMAEALEARGVPVILNSGADIFLSDEAKDLRMVLRAVLEPRSSTWLRRALATELIGLDASALSTLETPDADGRTPLELWREVFGTWFDVWIRQGPAALFVDMDKPRAGLLPQGVSRRLAALRPGGERRATNFRQLTDLLLEAAREVAPQPSDLVRWLGQRIAQADDRAAPEEHQMQLASEGDAVRVLTMHRAKGLEFDFVLCPDLVRPLKAVGSGVYLFAACPGVRDRDELADLERAEPKYRQEKLRAALEEELRLAYVALTRARIAAWTCSYSVPSHKSHMGVGALDWLLRSDAEIEAYPRCDEAWMAQAKAKLATKVDPVSVSRHDRHKAALEGIVARCRDIAVEPWPGPSDGVSGGTVMKDGVRREGGGELDAERLRALEMPMVPEAWRTTSFSQIADGREGQVAASERADVVSVGADEETEPWRGVVAGEAMGAAVSFLRSPAGAAVGTAVHGWIEGWDFSEVAAPVSPLETGTGSAGVNLAVVETALQRHIRRAGLPQPKPGQPEWEPALRELFNTLRTVRLPGAGDASLAELCPQAYASEWRFYLPLRNHKGGADGGFSARALGECFTAYAPEAYRDYGRDVAAMGADEVEGFLQGIIDRVIRVGDGWGLVDWKTNRLGADLAAYDEPGLWRCVRETHYLLQMHLYLVALRRWRRALGEAEPNIAGAWLVFLRGIEIGSSRGVLAVRPPLVLLEALDALFASQPLARGCGGQR